MVYLCYIDESGTPQIPGNTSYYVLLGYVIPLHKWKFYDREIEKIKHKYFLQGKEIHTGWILRQYYEQSQINNFENLSYQQRKIQVEIFRKKEIYRLKKQNPKALKQTKKNFIKTKDYVHLTYNERLNFINEIADFIGKQADARIFGEAVDKVHFNPSISSKSIEEQSFEQLVSRFEQYLKIRSKTLSKNNKDSEIYGILIHDNNDTVSKRFTELMKFFQHRGTLWTSVEKIIETPLFVDSQLTGMIQIADLCSYAVRRYLENGEKELFEKIQSRFDRKDGKIVGFRHFSDKYCTCRICKH